MAKRTNGIPNGAETPANFKIEGNRATLLQLAKLIGDTVAKDDGSSSDPVAIAGRIGGRMVEVRLRPDERTVRNVIESRNDAAELLEGWAENKKCVSCGTPIALLFEEEYLESPSADGPICTQCFGDSLDGEEAI
jgi:hypothetical protein